MMHVDVNNVEVIRIILDWRYNLYDARGCKYHKYRKALRENDIATYMMHVGG